MPAAASNPGSGQSHTLHCEKGETERAEERETERERERERESGRERRLQGSPACHFPTSGFVKMNLLIK